MRLGWEPSPLLGFHNRLSWIPVLGLLWSTSAYVDLDSFSYSANSPCLFSNAEEHQFSLLDPSDGMPFAEVDGQLRKVSTTVHPLPKFHVSKPSEEQSSVDVLLNSSYLGLFDTGRLGFVNRSSNGLNPVTEGNQTFITSVFDLSCNGTISIRLPDLLQYNFIYHVPTRGILGLPNGNQKALQRRASNALHSFVKRTEQAIKRDLPDSWSPFHFLLGPLKVSDRDQIGYQPRCPGKPFGLESFVKPGARPASFNGCGAENGMKIPELRFTECCDHHDLCYDDCSKTWNQCNEEFRTCMHGRCKNDPTWTEWGCNNIADVYADLVSTRLGAWSFRNSNDRCGCGCPGGTMNCTDMCLPDCRERCKIVDCTAETTTGKLSKSTPSASLTSPKTVTSPGLGPGAPVGTANGDSTLPLTTAGTSNAPSKTSSTPSTAPPSNPPESDPESDCVEFNNSSWWPFKSPSTKPCFKKKATVKPPKSRSAWWPVDSWFATTKSPPKNEDGAVTSAVRSETAVWWWPALWDA